MSNSTIHFNSSLRSTQTDATALPKYAGTQFLNSSSASQTDKTGVAIKSDQTSLSAVSSLVTKALSGSDVRTEKVASLQKAIASGTYHVSSAKVADKLLQSLSGE